MKILIYVNYSNKEFNKDFSYANLLIEKGHNVLLVTNDVQLNSAKDYYDILLWGYSNDRPENVEMVNLKFSEFLETNNIILV
ncbi:MAG: hypothetical protein E7345_00675 [Clostridiales bacterium]|nr:hypothetical protein [Clostridiales bacterium]